MSESSDLPQASATTSEADADHEGGTASPDGQKLAGIGDDQLPEDLQPGEDNPLAEPLDPDAEETKDADELGMDDTQDDTTGTFHTDGDLGESDETGATGGSAEGDETDPESVSGDGANGAGISG
ncbi:hypothetical protein [Nocardioides currus]|uniref:Uncharacterized protein n=1 Tax=Nocardioides currus TaxID=2133958 RepID=A0A2R7YWI3_9ACTN|nr:hypothetical protein [Nocardioides currus]PUA80416.1 hypothetical protein C7S10_14945 [Nocardioides currus]